jgi:hypothetical protein
MLRRVSELKGYSLQAIDGRFGTISDLLFDDQTWKARWIVVDTGGWLSDRQVLILPSAIGKPDDVQRLLPVDLTKARIEASPDIMSDQSVSLRMQANLSGYYGWDSYGLDTQWQRLYNDGQADDGDPHLRSTNAVNGYDIHAADGNIGHVENFLVDDQDWGIAYLVIDTRNWWPGEHVLVAPATVANIDWSSRTVNLRVIREQVRNSRAWQAEATLPETDREKPYSHYDRPA